MYTKDIERLVRMFLAQKLEPGYIRHYLEESYQLDRKTIDEIFTKLNVMPPNPKGGGKPVPGDASKIKKQQFF